MVMDGTPASVCHLSGEAVSTAAVSTAAVSTTAVSTVAVFTVGAAIAEKHLGDIRIVEYVYDIADNGLRSPPAKRLHQKKTQPIPEAKMAQTTAGRKAFANTQGASGNIGGCKWQDSHRSTAARTTNDHFNFIGSGLMSWIVRSFDWPG
jgi:hypothetical protein